jgi:hypothetical protein
VLMSGLAWATVHTVRQAKTEKAKTETTVNVPADSTASIAEETVATDTIATVAMEPVVFDNVPLDQMLTEIAGYYGMTVAFQNDEARNLRFHFVWNKDGGLAKVLEDLSHFDSVNIQQTDDQLIVQ